jgi:type II secretory pathway pseudopilin PulG
MLLLGVVIAGVVLAALGTSWHLMARREREAELLWRGEQYRRALISYGKVSAASLSASSAAASYLMQPNAAMQAGTQLGAQATTQTGTQASTSLGTSAQAAVSAAKSISAATATSVDSASGVDATAASSPAAGPRELKDLLEDRRTGKLVRHLRQLYPDPITGLRWGVQRSADGRVTGVYSISGDHPVRRSLGVESYRELVFGATAELPAAPAASAASGARGAP